MEITAVKIRLAKNEGRLHAFATITVDGCLVIRDLKIIDGLNGLFVSMPSKKQKEGNYRDIVLPTNSETREMIERSVLAEYQRLVEQSGRSVPRQT